MTPEELAAKAATVIAEAGLTTDGVNEEASCLVGDNDLLEISTPDGFPAAVVKILNDALTEPPGTDPYLDAICGLIATAATKEAEEGGSAAPTVRVAEAEETLGDKTIGAGSTIVEYPDGTNFCIPVEMVDFNDSTTDGWSEQAPVAEDFVMLSSEYGVDPTDVTIGPGGGDITIDIWAAFKLANMTASESGHLYQEMSAWASYDGTNFVEVGGEVKKFYLIAEKKEGVLLPGDYPVDSGARQHTFTDLPPGDYTPVIEIRGGYADIPSTALSTVVNCDRFHYAVTARSKSC